MHVQARGVVCGVVDPTAVLGGRAHVAQRAGSLEDLGAHQPVVGAARVVLGGLASHVGECFVDAAGLARIGQVGVLLGETMRDLVRGHVQADQRVEGAGAVTEGHRRTVPERVLVAAAVMHAHHQLERQRVAAQVGVVHVEDHAAEIMRVVQRRICAVDGLHRIARAGVGKRGAAGRAAVEVHGLHVGVVHGARGARLGHVEITMRTARAVLVLAGLGIAARAGADQGMLQVVPLLQDLAAVGIDDDRRAGGHATERGVGEIGHHVGAVGIAVVIQPDRQLGFVAESTHETDTVGQAGTLADHERTRGIDARGADRDLGRQAGDLLAEQGTQVAAGVLGHDDLLAEDRQAAEGLLVAMGAHAAIGLALHQHQVRFAVEVHRLGVTGMDGAGGAGGGDGRIGLLCLQQVAAVQVGTGGSGGASCAECQQDGAGEHVRGVRTVHVNHSERYETGSGWSR